MYYYLDNKKKLFQVVVSRVLESWDALKLYFTGAVPQDNLRNTQHILEAFNTPVVKLYLRVLFLSYILDIVNKINIEFQSEQPKNSSVINAYNGYLRYKCKKLSFRVIPGEMAHRVR
jgi:hypothetical protein